MQFEQQQQQEQQQMKNTLNGMKSSPLNQTNEISNMNHVLQLNQLNYMIGQNGMMNINNANNIKYGSNWKGNEQGRHQGGRNDDRMNCGYYNYHHNQANKQYNSNSRYYYDGSNNKFELKEKHMGNNCDENRNEDDTSYGVAARGGSTGTHSQNENECGFLQANNKIGYVRFGDNNHNSEKHYQGLQQGTHRINGSNKMYQDEHEHHPIETNTSMSNQDDTKVDFETKIYALLDFIGESDKIEPVRKMLKDIFATITGV